jgi:hypothetical protein
VTSTDSDRISVSWRIMRRLVLDIMGLSGYVSINAEQPKLSIEIGVRQGVHLTTIEHYLHLVVPDDIPRHIIILPPRKTQGGQSE